jgi:hypothetical protein
MIVKHVQSRRAELQRRIELLRSGILPPMFRGRPMGTFVGAGTGAGPQGKTYRLYSETDGGFSRMVSVPVYPHDHPLARYAYETELGPEPGTLRTANGAMLKSIPVPRYLSCALPSGIPLADRGIIMSHCYDTCTSVLAYRCRHYERGEECRYCGINTVEMGVGGYPDVQDLDEFVEAVRIAQQKEHVRSLTITTGTFCGNEAVVSRYIELLERIRRVSDIGIHIQFEPVDDLSLIGRVAAYAQSVGIFLEIFDERIRPQICPGKARNSREKYVKNWAEAAKHFPRGSVTTTCLLGFGEEYVRVIDSAEEFARAGATTALLFVRSNNAYMRNRVPSYLERPVDELLDLHLQVAESLCRHDVQFRPMSAAGCAGCQGCNAMVEACELVANGA